MVGTTPLAFWELLERVSNYFYDPTVFWGLPLLLAVLWEIFRNR